MNNIERQKKNDKLRERQWKKGKSFFIIYDL